MTWAHVFARGPPGVLNSGFLTTLTGLGGRVVGNMIVTFIGRIVEHPAQVDDLLMVPLYVVWLLTIALYYAHWSRFSLEDD